jgi:hypothetical protein
LEEVLVICIKANLLVRLWMSSFAIGVGEVFVGDVEEDCLIEVVFDWTHGPSVDLFRR